MIFLMTVDIAPDIRIHLYKEKLILYVERGKRHEENNQIHNREL